MSLRHKGNQITDNVEMANVFNDHFTNVVKNLLCNLPDPNCKHSDFLQSPNSSSMYLIPTSSFELKRLIAQTKSKMSAGLDCIPSVILKYLPNNAIQALCNIFN